MGRRLTGSLMFLMPALSLFEMAGRLASDQRAGWGWFLFAGLVIVGDRPQTVDRGGPGRPSQGTGTA